MADIVTFRKFEERDIDFIFKCKNDERLNSLTVGQYHPFTYEEAVQWVRNCMKGDRSDLKFWAISTNDEEKRIIGWISLSDINQINKSACFHGIVIADPKYNDGMTWIESHLFIYHYGFEVLGLNRIWGSCIREQKSSLYTGIAMLNEYEGVARQAVYKNGCFHDVIYTSLLREDYLRNKEAGEYEFSKIIRRIYKAKKEKGEKVVVIWNNQMK